MNTIIVFKPTEIQDIKSSKPEREIIYDTFAKNASIPAFHFSTFMEMENYEYDKHINSTLSSILIKSILQYCTPIIKTIPEFTVRTKTVDIFKQKKEYTRITEDKYYNISLQLEYPIVCKLAYNKSIITKLKLESVVIPKHETFKIIGIIIPQKIVKIQDNAFLNRMLELNVIDILKAGCFGMTDFQSGIYTQSRLDKCPLSPNIKPVYFISDSDAVNKIQIIDKYIKYVNNFYQTSSMLYKYTQIKPFCAYITEQKTLFNIFNSEFYKKNTKIAKNPISELLSKLIHSRLGLSNYSNDFIFDKYKVFDQMHQIKLLGLTNPLSKKKIQDLDIKKSYLDDINSYDKLKFIKMLEYAKKKAIAYNKFKISNISNLSNTQMKIIELEFNKLESFYKDIHENTPDNDLVNSLFWAIQNDKTNLIKERLSQVEKIVTIPKDFIKEPRSELNMFKNSKKYNIICPHVIAKAHYMIKPAQTDLIKSGLLREFLINNFSLPVSDDGYFCRICGELLAEADADEIMKYVSGKRVSFVMEYDTLKSQIWKEVAHIITTYIKFKDAVNHKNIITSITNTLRPELGVIETNLAKIKSNSKDSIKDLMRIYTVVYTFAIVVNMINKNYGKITFSTRQTSNTRQGGILHKKLKNTSSIIEYKASNESSDKSSDKASNESYENPKKKKKNNEDAKKHKKIKHSKYLTIEGGEPDHTRESQKILQNIINNALFLILRILNITINNISSITIESIKPILIKAYKWTTSLQTDIDKPDKNENTEEMHFKNDKIYNYIQYALNLNEYNKKKGNSVRNPITTILGRSWETIQSDFKNNKSIYETAVIPDPWSDTKDGKYKYGSFKSLIEYVKNKLYNEYAVPYSQILEEHDKKYAYINKLSYELFYTEKRTELNPYNNIILHNNFMLKYNIFKSENIKIDKYYDNDGNRHTFDIFIYQASNNKGILKGSKKEYGKLDIIEWINNKDVKKTDEFKHLFIVDKRCSTCNVLMSQTKNISVEKAISKKDDINIFFKYFESRCPKGELHNFVIEVQKNKESCCSKCGITKLTVINQDSKYYDKYIKIYEKIIHEKIIHEKGEVEKIINSKKDIIGKKKFGSWKVNNAPILELSRVFKIKYNVWINLGLTINQKYNLIENEKINPSEYAKPNDIILRNVQLYNYYLKVVTLYYIIKNHETVKNMPYDLKQLMLKNSVRDLYKKLIELDKSILIQYDYYKDNEVPPTISNFLLYYISSTIIDIYNSMKNAGMEIAYDVCKFIINTIIESEKLLSEPDLLKFKSSIISDNNTDINTDATVDTNMGEIDVADDEYDGYESPAESEKSLAELDDAEPDDEFSIVDLDIEYDADENLVNNAMGF